MSLNKVNYVHGQTIISAQNMNDIQDEIIRLGEKEAVQSDWLEQDENSLAYIKNKPFSANLGQHRISYNIDEDVTDSDLIEVTLNGKYSSYYSGTYYLFNVGSSDIMEQELIRKVLFDQRVAFEYLDGSYSTLYDMYNGIGSKMSLLGYGFDNPNIIGAIYFNADIVLQPERGVVVIENSTDPDISKGIYICFNSQKKSDIKKVLENFYSNSSLSTVEMPLGVNYALYALEGVRYPLQPALESAMESLNNVTEALDNKVDKVGNKVLSDVNFTKAYENAVQSIDTIKSDISNLSIQCDDLEDIFLSGTATMARATEIAVNPYGVSLSAQSIGEELGKLALGQNSDKIFIFADENTDIVFIKMSDKTPTPEDISKGFTIVVSMLLNFSSSPLPSMIPMSPYCYIHIGDMEIDDNGWQFVNENLTITDGMMVFLEGLVVIVNDINNPFGFPEGVYTAMIPGEEIPVLCSGLQISGFDLNSSTAPVSQEQLGDISSILDSIIGEQVWTFTLEDGSTVDKVVISSD